jgi:hypothetical protein
MDDGPHKGVSRSATIGGFPSENQLRKFGGAEQVQKGPSVRGRSPNIAEEVLKRSSFHRK